MGWKKNDREFLPDQTRVRWHGVEGTAQNIYSRAPEDFIRVGGMGDNWVNYIHYLNLEVWEDEKPEPPAPLYEVTDYYQETATGALYKRQYDPKTIQYHYICVNAIKPSLRSTTTTPPAGFKRLYKEV